MKNILCCTVLYDNIKSMEANINEYKILNEKISNFLIIDDYQKNEIGFFKNCIIKKNEKKLNPVKLREYCIQYAIDKQYDYFMFIDADDVQLENKIKVLYKEIDGKNIDFVSHNMKIVDENSNIVKEKMFPKKNESITLKEILEKNMVGLGNTIFKTCKLTNCLPLNDTVICDWWMALNLLINGAKGIFLDEVLNHYVQYGKNTANLLSNTQTELDKEYEIKKRMYKELIERYKYSNTEIVELLNTLEVNLVRKLNNKKNKPIKKDMNYWWDLLND